MILLSEYRENTRSATVYLDGDVFVVSFDDSTQREYPTESRAESAAEDWVLGYVDSGHIHVLPRGANRNAG
jgi:hypothetical protein